jgi:hypothetical protein
MKPKKLNFKNIKNMLSRDEMKQIMAGSGDNCFDNYPNNRFCLSDCECSFFCKGQLMCGQCENTRCVHP